MCKLLKIVFAVICLPFLLVANAVAFIYREIREEFHIVMQEETATSIRSRRLLEEKENGKRKRTVRKSKRKVLRLSE